MAPPGAKAIIQLCSTQRGTWEPKGVDAWYIGPCLHHYRCLILFVPSTSGEHIFDSAQLYPTMIETPTNGPSREESYIWAHCGKLPPT